MRKKRYSITNDRTPSTSPRDQEETEGARTDRRGSFGRSTGGFQKLTANYEAPSEVAELVRVSTAPGALDTVKVVLLSLAEKQIGGNRSSSEKN
jgi:hypothetical protein